MRRAPQPYIDPYLAGVGVGLVLLAAYVVVGQGLGASGAFASVVASGTAAIQPTYAAVVGGVVMGVGAKLARGCTSGQALSGGALLSVGSWIFIVTCFAAGYALAPAARRLWR